MKFGWKNTILIIRILVAIGMVALYALRLGSEAEKPSDPYVLVIWAAFAMIDILLGLRHWVWRPGQTGAASKAARRD